MTDTCGHTGEATWQPDPANEAGWVCDTCGDNLGFRPDLDRDNIWHKARGVLLQAHEAELLYVSNSTMGDVIATHVAARCRHEDRYDQQSILAFCLADRALDSSRFWRDRADRWFADHLMAADVPL